MGKINLRDKIDAYLMDDPKTVSELMVLLPEYTRWSFNGRLSELKAQGKAVKNEKTLKWKWVRRGHLQKV